jgi:hypothetical protein
MTDSTIDTSDTGLSRRRFLLRASAAGAVAWTAPSVVGLDARAIAAGSACPPVFQDSIQAETPRLDEQIAAGGFSVTQGSVDVVGGSLFGSLVPPGYTNGIDLDGTASATTILSSPVVPAGSYRVEVTLSGDRRGDNDNSATVTLGIGGATRTLTSAEGPETVSFDVTLIAPDDLTISHTSGAVGDNIGMLLLAARVTPLNCTA